MVIVPFQILIAMEIVFDYRGSKIHCSLLRKAAGVPETQEHVRRKQSLIMNGAEGSSVDKTFFFAVKKDKVWSLAGFLLFYRRWVETGYNVTPVKSQQHYRCDWQVTSAGLCTWHVQQRKSSSFFSQEQNKTKKKKSLPLIYGQRCFRIDSNERRALFLALTQCFPASLLKLETPS